MAVINHCIPLPPSGTETRDATHRTKACADFDCRIGELEGGKTVVD
jgi:hypothetical protein